MNDKLKQWYKRILIELCMCSMYICVHHIYITIKKNLINKNFNQNESKNKHKLTFISF